MTLIPKISRGVQNPMIEVQGNEESDDEKGREEHHVPYKCNLDLASEYRKHAGRGNLREAGEHRY